MFDDPLLRRASHVRHPGLLVSVRNLEEAALVAELEVAILDFKEPSDGALAPVSPTVWRDVATQWSGKVCLSAALGEFDDAQTIAGAIPQSFTFAKMGPAGSGSIEELARRWSLIRDQLPQGVELVAVAYADYEAADCPSPLEIFTTASQQGLNTWLVDTFQKNGQTTLGHLSIDELTAIAMLAETTKSTWVLAGSMTSLMLANLRAAALCPNWIGVRGDVCDGARQGKIVQTKVKQWLAALSAIQG